MKLDYHQPKEWITHPVNESAVLGSTIFILPGAKIRKDPGLITLFGPGCTIQEDVGVHAHAIGDFFNWLTEVIGISSDMAKAVIKRFSKFTDTDFKGGIILGPVNNFGHKAVCHGTVLTGYNVFYGLRSTVHNLVTGNNVYIGHETKMFNCYVDDNVEIQEGCRIKNCIIGKNVRIGDFCTLKNCIIEDNTVVETRAEIIGTKEHKLKIGGNSWLSTACEVYVDINENSLVPMRMVVDGPDEASKLNRNIMINPVTDFGLVVWDHMMELSHISHEVMNYIKQEFFK